MPRAARRPIPALSVFPGLAGLPDPITPARAIFWLARRQYRHWQAPLKQPPAVCGIAWWRRWLPVKRLAGIVAARNRRRCWWCARVVATAGLTTALLICVWMTIHIRLKN